MREVVEPVPVYWGVTTAVAVVFGEPLRDHARGSDLHDVAKD